MKSADQLNYFVDLLLGFRKKSDMKEFLLGILTEKEIEEIPKRLSIVNMLKKNIPQHEVALKLGVGVGTVTRASKELQKGRFKIS
ncbi:MAG: Trp family transcriptional regulator [Ignavibacteria bacterium]